MAVVQPRSSGDRVAANVRNFCIIAHIDHGKTTLSDRLLEVTRTVAQRQMEEQLLDAIVFPLKSSYRANVERSSLWRPSHQPP